jgi:ATP-dependent Clp protease ATP-binding subunit ClpA
MVNRFSTAARRCLSAATAEAALRGDRRVGTDHLLLGLLHHAPAATALGVDLPAARAALDDLDRRALAAVGVEAPDGLLPRAVSAGRLPFTAAAGDALRQTLREAQRADSRHLEPPHLLLALLGRSGPDAATDLLAALGVDPDLVRLRLDPAA